LVGSPITAIFSEDIDPATLTTDSFRVVAGNVAVAGTVSYGSRIATFVPSSAIATGTTVDVTLTTALRTVRGAGLAVAHTWSFRSADLVGWVQPERIGGTVVGLAVWAAQGKIYAAEYNASAKAWSAPFRVDTGGGENPAVSVDAFGGGAVVWERSAVVYGVLHTFGTSWGMEQALSTGGIDPAQGKLRPDVVRTLYEGMLVAWGRAIAGASPTTQVRARRWTSANGREPEVTVWSTPGLTSAPPPRFAPGGGPDFLLSWSINGSTPATGAALYTGGSWQIVQSTTASDTGVSSSILSRYQASPVAALASASGGRVDVRELSWPSSSWTTTSMGGGASSAVALDVFGRLVVVWSAPVGASGIFATRRP
jgi:hypothetical protein